jgi:hypothetical protein
MSEDKYVVFDEYKYEFLTTSTKKKAIDCAVECLEEMFKDGGADCEMSIYKRIGTIAGTLTVETEEQWDEDQKEETVGEDESIILPRRPCKI